MNPGRRKMDQQQFEASVNGWEEIWMEERAGREEEMAGWEKGIAHERMTRRRWLHVEKNASCKALQKPTGISLVVLLFHFTKSKIANYCRGAVFLLGI